MRKISARGFIIIRLCSATVPTDSIYEKKNVLTCSSYHFPLKRVPTIFGYFDTLLINSPYFASFALCSGLFL